MPGFTKVALIEDNQEPLVVLLPTGVENELIYSKNFLDNPSNLRNLIASRQVSLPEVDSTLLSPYDYGLNVFDLTKKKIHSLTSYDSVGLIHVSHLKYYASYESYESFKALVEEEKLFLYKKNDANQYSFKDLFKTKNIKDIVELIDKNNEEGHFNDFFIKPINFNCEIIRYTPMQLDKYFLNLIQEGLNFNEVEVSEWLTYPKKESNEASYIIENIKTYSQALYEKNSLNNTLKKPQNNIKSVKL